MRNAVVCGRRCCAAGSVCLGVECSPHGMFPPPHNKPSLRSVRGCVLHLRKTVCVFGPLATVCDRWAPTVTHSLLACRPVQEAGERVVCFIGRQCAFGRSECVISRRVVVLSPNNNGFLVVAHGFLCEVNGLLVVTHGVLVKDNQFQSLHISF